MTVTRSAASVARRVTRFLTWSSAALFTALAAPVPASAAVNADTALTDIKICHGFGCRFEETIHISAREWRQIEAFFKQPAPDPEAEREQIRRAAGWFEVIAGRHTPIHLDKGGNAYPDRYGYGDGNGRRGQMDCIDESLNMQAYLKRMQDAGLFRYHRVVERAHRASALDQHYAGQIEEIESGQRWVVDSWFYDFGNLPYVEEARKWQDIPFLFRTSFQESPDD